MASIEIPALAVPRGKWGTVEFAIRSSGARLAEKFLEELKADPADFLALFQEMAENGRTNNPSHFSHEEGDIYAFKDKISNKQIRFPCFKISNRWLLTHGFHKKGAQRGRGKWRREDLDKAEEIMKEHLALERELKDRQQRLRNTRQR